MLHSCKKYENLKKKKNNGKAFSLLSVEFVLKDSASNARFLPIKVGLLIT